MLRRAISALALFLSAAVAASAQSSTEIRFGDVRAGPLQWQFFIAQREGFFKEEGITISTVSVGNPANIEALLDSGDIQMTSVGGDVCIGAVARHRAVKVVIGVELNTSPYQLMASPRRHALRSAQGEEHRDRSAPQR